MFPPGSCPRLQLTLPLSPDLIANKLHMQKVSDFVVSPGGQPSKVSNRQRESGRFRASPLPIPSLSVPSRLPSTSRAVKEPPRLSVCTSTPFWEDLLLLSPTRASSRPTESACSGTRKVGERPESRRSWSLGCGPGCPGLGVFSIAVSAGPCVSLTLPVPQALPCW